METKTLLFLGMFPTIGVTNKNEHRGKFRDEKLIPIGWRF